MFHRIEIKRRKKTDRPTIGHIIYSNGAGRIAKISEYIRVSAIDFQKSVNEGRTIRQQKKALKELLNSINWAISEATMLADEFNIVVQKPKDKE